MSSKKKPIGRPSIRDDLKKKKISITLPAHVHEALEGRRDQTGQSISEFIADALKNEIERSSKQSVNLRALPESQREKNGTEGK